MSDVIDRFLQYVQIDTQSREESSSTPTTMKQHDLAKLLAEQLKEMGAEEIVYDKQHCYVYASVPAAPGYEEIPVLGYIAHMDTSPAVTGTGVNPRIITGYDGGDICLNREKNVVMKISDFPSLLNYRGQDIIVTDGTTLLGADDKAGIAEIMAAAKVLLEQKDIPSRQAAHRLYTGRRSGRRRGLF